MTNQQMRQGIRRDLPNVILYYGLLLRPRCIKSKLLIKLHFGLFHLQQQLVLHPLLYQVQRHLRRLRLPLLMLDANSLLLCLVL